MPRTKEFDVDEVLDHAMQTFWEQGYECTSVQDLLDATGLSRSSLYESFGNKHDLYLAALDRYRQREAERLAERLASAPTASGAIREVFEEAASACIGDGRGCFLVNATVERARSDDATERRMRASLQGMEEAFAAAVERGQHEGCVDSSLDPASAARFLVTTYRGLHATAHLRADRSATRDVVDTVVGVLTSKE